MHVMSERIICYILCLVNIIMFIDLQNSKRFDTYFAIFTTFIQIYYQFGQHDCVASHHK